ncbi:hypothetical protein Tco_1444891, partial [Tanacetum coccineum]
FEDVKNGMLSWVAANDWRLCDMKGCSCLGLSLNGIRRLRMVVVAENYFWGCWLMSTAHSAGIEVGLRRAEKISACIEVIRKVYGVFEADPAEPGYLLKSPSHYRYGSAEFDQGEGYK